MANDQETITIINGCKDGNRKAQQQLYKNYYRAMIGICLRYTKQEEDAVEVLNNGFLKVFKNIQRYDPAQASLYTWIRTIVVHSCLDFIRSKQNKEKHSELSDSVEIHIAPEVLGKIKATELLELVRQLTPATGAVFNLYVIEGYTHKEIGKLLGISDGTSKWHLSEARKKLQHLLKNEEVKIND